MRLIKRQTKKPAGGYSTIVHILLTASLPILAYILVRLDFVWVAITLVLLSKWRMLAVKVRHWPANIRANAVDIFMGVSLVLCMGITDVQSLQILWAGIYATWLLAIKPQSSELWIGLQALIAQAFALATIFLFWAEASTALLVLLVWGVAYLCARHFLAAFDEAMSRATAYAWAFFAASIAWLSGHWLIYYGSIAQPALLLTVLGYGLSSMYYLEHKDRLTSNLRRQFVSVMVVVVMFLIVFSDWSDKTV